MKPLDRLMEGELSWIQPRAMKGEYELRADGEAIATLRWVEPFGSLANAEAEAGHWSFKRVGFLHPKVTVRVAGSEIDIVTVEVGWTGSGVLQFTIGRRYRWLRTSFWDSEWAFAVDDGHPLIRFQPKVSLRRRGTVIVEPLARGSEDLSPLLLLGWYLIVLMSRDAAVAATAVPAVVTAG